MKKSLMWFLLAIIAVETITIGFLLFRDDSKKYKITFNSDDKILSSEKVTIGNLITKPADPTKEGYIFDGWYNGEEKYDFNMPVVSEINLTAKWKLEGTYYTITFNTNGGSNISSQSIREGEAITSLLDPTKEGYVFNGWLLNGKSYDLNTSISSDLTLVADWKVKGANEFTITYDSNGGSSVASQTIVSGTKITKPTNPTKLGYAFSSWQLDGETYDFNTPVTKDIRLVATWTAKEQYTVTFNSDGGSSVSSKKVYSGDAIGSMTTPTKSGFQFQGWYNETTKYTSTTKITKSITLKASWLTNDQANLNAAKASLQNITITSGGQTLSASATGCNITLIPSESIEKITRETSNRTITITANIVCGSATGTKTINGIISASPYKYTAVANSNNLNYNVMIYNGSTKLTSAHEMFSNNQTPSSSSFPIGEYSSSYGYAAIDNAAISSYPTIKLIIGGNYNTVYVVTKK